MPKLHIGSPPRDQTEMTRKLNSLLHLIEEALSTHTANIAAIQAQIDKLQAAKGSVSQ